MSKRIPLVLRGTGTYVPDEVLDNQHFVNYLDTNDEWIVSRTGIRERRRAAPHESSATMAIEACRRALEQAELSPSDMDVIICATATPDCVFPATAAFIQGELGAPGVAAFDVSAACAGFLYGSIIAAGFLGGGIYKRALVVGTETLTRYPDPEDRTTAVLFGDGAGAAIYETTTDTDRGVLFCDLGCEGTRAEHIWVPAGGSRLFTSEATVAERLHYLRMKGREVYKFAVLKMHELVDEALQTSGVNPDDLKLVIPHQSNLRIIESVRARLGLPREKVVVNIDRYGNTSAASIPIALDEARRNGTVGPGDLVLMVAIGAGLAWGTMIVRL